MCLRDDKHIRIRVDFEAGFCIAYLEGHRSWKTLILLDFAQEVFAMLTWVRVGGLVGHLVRNFFNSFTVANCGGVASFVTLLACFPTGRALAASLGGKPASPTWLLHLSPMHSLSLIISSWLAPNLHVFAGVRRAETCCSTEHSLTSLLGFLVEVISFHYRILTRDAKLVKLVFDFIQLLLVFFAFPLEVGIAFLGCQSGTVEKDADLHSVGFLFQFVRIKEEIPILFQLRQVLARAASLRLSSCSFRNDDMIRAAESMGFRVTPTPTPTPALKIDSDSDSNSDSGRIY